MQRFVLHWNMPDFPVAVERLRDPRLRGRPVIISQPNPRSRVLAVSNEARSWGVAAGMDLSAAVRVCRDATLLPPNERLYAKAHGAVLEVLGEYAPVAESERAGRIYADLSGTQRLFGPIRDTAHKISKEVAERLGLRARLGLSANKSTSAVASAIDGGRGPHLRVRERAVKAGIEEGDRAGMIPCPVPPSTLRLSGPEDPAPGHAEELVDVFPGDEASFLAPQAADLLPGVESVDVDLLDELNIRVIRQFAREQPQRLCLVFGRMGGVLHQRANGRDPRPVRAAEKKPAFENELELPEDSNARDELLDHLLHLVEECGHRMRRAGRIAREARLAVGYCDDIFVEGRGALDFPSNLDTNLFAAARRLFARIVARRVRVSYLRIAFGELAACRTQLELFRGREDAPRETALEAALDEIRDKYGMEAVHRMSMMQGVRS